MYSNINLVLKFAGVRKSRQATIAITSTGDITVGPAAVSDKSYMTTWCMHVLVAMTLLLFGYWLI